MAMPWPRYLARVFLVWEILQLRKEKLWNRWQRWQQIAADVHGLDMLRPRHHKCMQSARPARTCLRQKHIGAPQGPLLCMDSQRGMAKNFQSCSCIDVWSLKPSRTCVVLARGKPRVVAMIQHAVAALVVFDVTQDCGHRTLFVGCNPLIDKNATLSTATEIEVQAAPQRPGRPRFHNVDQSGRCHRALGDGTAGKVPCSRCNDRSAKAGFREVEIAGLTGTWLFSA